MDSSQIISLKTVFMGSPEFAVPILRKLAERAPLVGVVTQPDRPSGRGQTLTPPPVKILAQDLGLPVIQPRRLKEPEVMEQLRDWRPELIVVAAFGQILRPEVLDLPSAGCVNVHASLLPRWRGAAPVQAAILHGDSETGITIMRMDPGIDTGPILGQHPISIHNDDTTASLSERLSILGADFLVEILPEYIQGNLIPHPQEESPEHEATYAPMLKKEDGLLDFRKPAEELARQVRAFNRWPGAYTTWQGQILKIHKAHNVEASQPEPGVPLIYQGLPAIGAAGSLLVLDEVQPAGKKPMAGKIFLNGARDWAKKRME